MRATPLLLAVVLSVTSRAPAQGVQMFADLGTCPTASGEVVRE